MLVPSEIMQKEFLDAAQAEGIADIEELNKILDRAINLKNFLKGKQRIEKVARYVADHFRNNVEPVGRVLNIGRPGLVLPFPGGHPQLPFLG